MIYQRLIVTDQSYEVSCHDKKIVLCPRRFSCPAQRRENKTLRENRRVEMFAVAGYHAVVCDAFISLVHWCGPFFRWINVSIFSECILLSQWSDLY